MIPTLAIISLFTQLKTQLWKNFGSNEYPQQSHTSGQLHRRLG